MNIVNKLTIRHMKQNKRRTLVTLIGVIISVAMVTAVATLSLSFLDVMKKEVMTSGGNWHVVYQDINKEQLEAIKKDKATKAVAISRDVGFAHLEGSQNENKPYLFIREYDAKGFQNFPVELSEGRLPEAANEVVISEDIAMNAKVNYRVGDTLTLDAGQREEINMEHSKEHFRVDDSLLRVDDEINETIRVTETKKYTIVGVIKRPVWEPAWAPSYSILSYVDESLLEADDTIRASVVLNKVRSSLYSDAEQLAKENNIDEGSVSYNHNLLRFHGITKNDKMRNTLFSLSAIIMSVIIIGSVSLIYNAFAISVSERSRHLGMLSSVGATKRQKRNSVFFEGAIIGLISIPIGFLCGLIGIGLTFMFINTIIEGALGVSEKLSVVVTPFSIMLASAVSILTIFISTYLPAIRASKISAIDAIRQSADVKLTGKAVKTSRLVRKLFGIEAEIGLKNLKRNKRRYKATVFSLVISIVLFLAVSYFTDNLKRSMEISQSGVNYDIQVSIQDKDNDAIKSIASLDDVTEYSVSKQYHMQSRIDEASIADELRERVKLDHTLLQDGKLPYSITVYALDEHSMRAYLKKIGANERKLTDPDQPAAIVIDTIPYEDVAAGKYVETKAIYAKVGQKLEMEVVVGEAAGELSLRSLQAVEIAALTDKFPMGAFSAGVGSLSIVMSEQVMNKWIANIEYDAMQTIYLSSSDPMATQNEIEDMKLTRTYVYNVYQSRQSEQQMILFMSVFTYGFIMLITAISIANIFNTTSTSIALRKREFAMLKSVGMTPKGFNKMINYESIFYGVKSLLYGLPISIVVMYLIHKALMNSFRYSFELPWMSMIYVVVAVFIIVTAAMLYSSSKVKKENIIDALKQDNI